MFALVDCDAFFVSCERVFRPDLERKPVIVLSSNDGCSIARPPEAKALGIAMGVPYFKIQDIVRDLFSLQNTAQIKIREKLLFNFDQLNRRFGRGTLKFASKGTRKTSWHPKSLLISPLYTQRWDQLREVV